MDLHIYSEPELKPAALMPAAQRRAWTFTATQLFDRAAVGATIAEAHAQGLSGDELRKAALNVMRQELEEGRNKARHALEATSGGFACAQHLSVLEDELIRALYDFITTRRSATRLARSKNACARRSRT
jgi:hypothetical protein